MLTGAHFVRDVMCKSCGAKLGWFYELAREETQRYKEGRVILERALVDEVESQYDDMLVPPQEIQQHRMEQ